MKRRTVTSTTDVLEICKTLKLARAQLYHYFADLFKSDRESLLLWLKKAMEEENHSRLFSLVAKLRQDGIIESIQIDAGAAQKARKHVRSLLRSVKNNPPSHREALLMAIDIENMGNVTEDAIAFADESFAKLFLPISRGDARGLESLQEAYAQAAAASS